MSESEGKTMRKTKTSIDPYDTRTIEAPAPMCVVTGDPWDESPEIEEGGINGESEDTL